MSYAQDYATGAFVSTLAHALLASAAGSLASPPADQWVSMGEPAADGCDQLVVWVNKFRLGFLKRQTRSSPGILTDNRTPMEPGGALPMVDMTVQLLRCGAPQATGDLTLALPSPTAMDTHGTTMLTDGWALYHGLIAAWSAGTLFGSPNPIPAHHTLFEPMTAYGPESGVSGWTIPITLSLF